MSDINEDYEIYLRERELLIRIEKEQSNLLDRSILYISSGAFGISLTFVNQIAPFPRNGTLVILEIAWISLFICIVATLFSFIFSQKAIWKNIKTLEERIFNGSTSEEKESLESKITRKLNICSIITFLVGILLLGVFVGINL